MGKMKKRTISMKIHKINNHSRFYNLYKIIISTPYITILTTPRINIRFQISKWLAFLHANAFLIIKT